MNKKIGILGGTFNPIHEGHIKLAYAALSECDLDEVWFMPTKITYYKNEDKEYDINKIIKNIDDAIKNIEKFKLCKFEIDEIDKDSDFLNKYGTNYILNCLKEKYNGYDFYFILGADSLYNIETWKSHEDLLKNNKIIVADRRYNNKTNNDLIEYINYLNDKYKSQITLLKMERIDISSTNLRNGK